MAKGRDGSRVLVVPTDILFGKGGEHRIYGFRYADSLERDYESIIRETARFVDRESVEHNPDFQQVVAWGILVNQGLRQACVYKRSKDYFDPRLRNQWSFGLGGHVREVDYAGQNTWKNALIRDVGGGRIRIYNRARGEDNSSASFEYSRRLGYISLPWQVNSVHFGLVSLVETDATKVVPVGSDFSQGRMMTLREIVELGADKKEQVDDWSSNIWPLMMHLLFHKD
jgi:predicted NUDIX family phosphoesterase